MSKPRKKAEAQDVKPRDPNRREKEAIAAAREAHKHRPARAEFANKPTNQKGVAHLASPHSDEEGVPYLVAETFASGSNDFTTESLLRLVNATGKNGDPSMRGLNASLAVIGAIAPRDEFEACIATQMAVTHDLCMSMLQKTKDAKFVETMKEYGNLATKLQRTFTAQIKALSDWRRGGEQVVRHVHVYPGGQAVVAGTFNAGGQNEISENKPHEQGPCSSAMLGCDPEGHGLPVSGDERQDPVQAPRRQKRGRGSTKGE